MTPADRGRMAARLDANRTAKPRTRLVAKVSPTDCYLGGATHYEGDDGQRVALWTPTKRNGPSTLLAAVNAALRVIGSAGRGAEEHADGSVWLDSMYVESDADAFYVMRESILPGGAHSDQLGGGFYRRERGDAWAMRQAASALVREWVREQLDAWVQDDGKGE